MMCCVVWDCALQHCIWHCGSVFLFCGGAYKWEGCEGKRLQESNVCNYAAHARANSGVLGGAIREQRANSSSPESDLLRMLQSISITVTCDVTLDSGNFWTRIVARPLAALIHFRLIFTPIESERFVVFDSRNAVCSLDEVVYSGDLLNTALKVIVEMRLLCQDGADHISFSIVD